jgi:hypothetical protein
MTHRLEKVVLGALLGCGLALIAGQASAELMAGALCHAEVASSVSDAQLRRDETGIMNPPGQLDAWLVCGASYPGYNGVDATAAYVSYYDSSASHFFLCNAHAAAGSYVYTSTGYSTCSGAFGCALWESSYTGYGTIVIPNPLNSGNPINGVTSMSVTCTVPPESKIQSYGFAF